MVKKYPDAYLKERVRHVRDNQGNLRYAHKRRLARKKPHHRQASEHKQRMPKYQSAPLTEKDFSNDKPCTQLFSVRAMLFCSEKPDSPMQNECYRGLLNIPVVCKRFFNCHINNAIFLTWLTECLIPVLSERSVIVMDNVAFHRRHNILQAINDSRQEIHLCYNRPRPYQHHGGLFSCEVDD